MTQTHLLSDSISRIRNAQLIKKKTVVLLFSKLIDSFSNILLKEGYIKNKNVFFVKKNIRKIKIYLKYKDILNNPSISKIKVISKPGQRVYRNHKNIPTSYGGLGIYMLSTSKGIVTDREARKIGTGGEILCKLF